MRRAVRDREAGLYAADLSKLRFFFFNHTATTDISPLSLHDALPISLIAMAVVFGVLAVRHLERHAHPLVELSAMRVHSFSIGMWTGILFRMAVGATPVLLPLMFQRGFGLTAFAAGVLTLGYAIGNIGMKPLTTPILRQFGFRGTLIADALLSSA